MLAESFSYLFVTFSVPSDREVDGQWDCLIGIGDDEFCMLMLCLVFEIMYLVFWRV